MSIRETIPLVIAGSEKSYPRMKSVVDGTISIPNCSTAYVRLGSGEMLSRAFEDPELNVAELSLSNYVTLTARGNCPYVALPVYIFRSFPQAGLYVRADRDISTPQTLRGRRIGISEYHHTVYVWTRGILEDEYGVHPSDIRWVSISKESHSDDEAFQPHGVSIERCRTDKTVSEMLETGEIDAMISSRPPACFTRGAPNVARLFANPAAVADDYFQRTEVFPIFHIMGVRPGLLKRDANLAEKLFSAFSQAKDRAFTPETETATPVSLKGRYSYGTGARDRKTLELFLDYHFGQGLSDRRLTIAELFAPIPMSVYEN